MGDPVMGSRRKYRGLKIVLAIVTLLLVAAWGYVAWVNRNTENMTGRQKILKAVYPLFMWWSNKKGVGTKKLGSTDVAPPVSFYSLKDTLINGTPFDFASLKGRKVLLVNTASDCGYTGQYDDLQKLSERYKDKLVVIGFPANDFKEQEKGNNNDIAEFCRAHLPRVALCHSDGAVARAPRAGPALPPPPGHHVLRGPGHLLPRRRLAP